MDNEMDKEMDNENLETTLEVVHEPFQTATVITPVNSINDMFDKDQPSIFLCGESTTWQSEVIKNLMDLPFYIINPVRIEETEETEETNNSIKWQISGQMNSDIILYYFDKDHDNAVTLHQFGLFCRDKSSIVICCEPGYKYASIVEFSAKISEFPVYSTLDESINSIRNTMNSFLEKKSEIDKLTDLIINSKGTDSLNELIKKLGISTIVGNEKNTLNIEEENSEEENSDCKEDCDCEEDCKEDCDCENGCDINS